MSKNMKELIVSKIISISPIDVFGRILVPLGSGFSTGWVYLQVVGTNYTERALIIGLIITAVLALIGNLVKLILGTKKISSDRTQDSNSTAVEVLKLSQTENARLLTEEKRFWSDRIDYVRDQLIKKHDEDIKFWVKREEVVREEKHTAINQCNATTLEVKSLKIQIHQYGGMIDELGNIIWPIHEVAEGTLKKINAIDIHKSAG